ncbi:MAG: hypothetical protein ACUVWN_14900 [bacterium]
MRNLFLIIILILVLISSSSGDLEARGMFPVNLNMISTAETLGKGGYNFSTGMFQYSIDTKTVLPMDIDIGGFFKEQHDVKLKSDIWLIPSRISYGITEKLDITFGGTYSAGDTEKSITDYYEIGDKRERVYPQFVLDGVLGMKYNIQKSGNKVPAMGFGGEVQMGYTVDDQLVDETLEDSFPFVGMLLYLVGSYDFEIINVHGGLGMYLSSKSIQSNKKFDVPVQVGAEVPFDGFAAVIDLTLFKPFSGIGFETLVSGGIRYDFSPSASFNAGVASVGGFIISLTFGGKKPVISTSPPSAPSLF